ncbi:MAG: hypothetical protein QOK33_4365 [Mycobacterium sp.]|jgi:hypothetical protein|nr:hypothetical protein [Mycobacterium sp.]
MIRVTTAESLACPTLSAAGLSSAIFLATALAKPSAVR